ncbi:MAG: hypothetical protein FWD04_12160 [Conexibacteraceae bacterium]|nr:hypothetical protein [Conexibacteraceae bacterium]
MLAAAALAVAGLAACGSTAGHAAKTTTSGRTTAASRLLTQGIAQADAKHWSQAITTFENVLVLSPGNLYALYNLGLIDQVRHDPRGAIARYNEALKTDNAYTPAMYNEALILEPKQPSAALALYQKIVAINPKASTAYLHMAMVYSRSGARSLAAQARAKAISLDPSLAKYPLPKR